MRRMMLALPAFLLSVLGSAAVSGADDRPIVAVFDIEAKGVVLPSDVMDRLNDYLASLLAGKNYSVVPKSQLKERLGQGKKESYKKCYDQACQIEIGQELAAQKILASQIIKLAGKCKLTMTLYDLKRSASEGGATVSGECTEEGIVDSLEKMIEKLVRPKEEIPAAAADTPAPIPVAPPRPAPPPGPVSSPRHR
jgi:hypothetical protein